MLHYRQDWGIAMLHCRQDWGIAMDPEQTLHFSIYLLLRFSIYSTQQTVNVSALSDPIILEITQA